MKCLVVDDSATMRRIVVNALKTIGYADVVEAGDGQDILQAVEAGVSSYILKSFTPQVLEEKLDQITRARSGSA
jgi:two-component system, chemotaxis family, chemotaxis protein CheY